jgi:hypothetical protein
MTDELFIAGCTDIRFVPGTTDEWRFGIRGKISPEFDVVLIGNNASSRLPWRTMPGARWRKKLVTLFEEKLGNRFAVFGQGWYGRSAQGSLPFEKQSSAYARGRIALGVNNLHATFYFSNRLPIAMSSGTPVIYNYEVGFERLFPSESGCLFYRNTEHAWEIARDFLSRSHDELTQMGRHAHDHAIRHFTITRVFHYMCDVLGSFHRRGDHGSVPCVQITNPWLEKEGHRG